MFKKLSHTMMYVTNLDRAVKFYTDKLNFKVRFHHPEAFASLYNEAMNCRLDLHPTEADSKDVGFGPIVYFASENIDRDLSLLKSMGVKTGEAKSVVGSPRFATFWDSEGNALGMEEEKK
jgi:catechol 2,3-dioxygenase-like lactoylglutathione lyase family enzyme